MSIPEPVPPSWVTLLTLMVHGPVPEPTLRGAIRSWPEPEVIGYVALGSNPLPVFAGGRPSVDGQSPPPPIRVWRDGHRLRIEEPDGTINLIVSDTTCWQFDQNHDIPLATPHTELRYRGSGTQLLTRRDASEFLDDDFTRPTGPVGATTFLGRLAWTVELAPPPHKPYPLQLVVDAETGIVLQERNDGFGTVEEWVEFVVGDTLDPALFKWDGQSRSEAVERAERDARHLVDLEGRRQWFADHVTGGPLHIELELDVLVHRHDDAGEFEASLGKHHIGMLARRPRSNQPWDLHWQHVQHRWRTPRWDWAMTFYDDIATADSIEALKQQLGQAD
jgi:hypothetical protein